MELMSISLREFLKCAAVWNGNMRDVAVSGVDAGFVVCRDVR